MPSFNWPPGGSGGGGGMVTNAANVGTGVGVFQVLSGSTLNFRSVTNGTGLTWVQNVNDIQGTVSLAPFSTTDLAEGTNLYFTQARARLSLSNSAPITYNSGTGVIGITQSGVATDGYLSSTDWNTFNNKQAAGSYITALTGDVTATGPGSVAATIANLAVTNAKIANATIDLTTKVTSVLPIANGGTNSSTTLNNNRIIISSGGAIVEDAAITANRALASDTNGIPVASTTTDTELGYVSGVTSSIQTQLNSKFTAVNVTQGAAGLVESAGQLLGTNDGSIPAQAGYVGEIIESIIGTGSAVSIPSNVVTNVTSVSIGEGDWLATAVVTLHGTLTGTGWLMSASDNNAVLGPIGDATIQTPTLPTAAYDCSQVITKEYTVPNGGSANIYAVVQASYTLGTATGYGRLTLRRMR